MTDQELDRSRAIIDLPILRTKLREKVNEMTTLSRVFLWSTYRCQTCSGLQHSLLAHMQAEVDAIVAEIARLEEISK